MVGLANKVVLVTGAASGIGRAAALAFGQAQAQVVVSDIAVEAGQKVTQEIIQQGGQAVFIEANIAQAPEVQHLVQEIVARYGRLDIAVNNAGIEGAPVRLVEIPEEMFDQIMTVNVKGVWLCMKAEIQQMLTQGGGVIINMASVAGLVGAQSLSVYSASKHAVVGLTKSAALEYARKGIRINAVCPSFVRTPMVERAFEHIPHLAEGMVQAHPSRRLAEPEEISAAVLWLASPAASFITGTALPVDGAFVAQ